MAWGRGFFRVWVVFSVLWILGAMSYYGSYIRTPALDLPGYLIPVDETIKPVPLIPGYGEYQHALDGVAANRVQLDDLWLTGFPAAFKVFAEASMDRPTFERRVKENIDFMHEKTTAWIEAKRGKMGMEAAQVAFGVPIALLFAGLVLKWVLSGFRKPKPATVGQA